MKPAADDYRTRIYSAYASRGRAQIAAFSEPAARRRAQYLAGALRGWLPADRGAAIADLGCGSGGLLYALKDFGYTELTGVDASAEQVELARQIVPDVVQGDLFELLDQRPGGFRLLTAFDVVEHLPKTRVLPFLDACQRALRPGGRLILQTPNAESPMSPAVRYGDFTHEVCFSPSSLGWLMELCGFEALESREGGPRPLGVLSLGRYLLWQAIRLGLATWNLAETGSAGSGIYTRVFLMTGTRRS